MKLKEIVHELDRWAPPQLAESYDNVGLLTGDSGMDVSGTLISLDVTEAVVEEAAQKGLQLIIAHHPVWFAPRKRLIPEDYVSRTLISAIKKDIAIFALHTNLDSIRSGVNQKISQLLGLRNIEFLLAEKTDPNGEPAGIGMIGDLPEKLSKMAFLELVRTTFGCGGIRYSDAGQDAIGKVAVCGGSGSFLIPDALEAGADAFVTADISYHKFFDSEGKMLLLDIGHYESEQFTNDLIADYLSKKFPNFAVHLTALPGNPVSYFS